MKHDFFFLQYEYTLDQSQKSPRQLLKEMEEVGKVEKATEKPEEEPEHSRVISISAKEPRRSSTKKEPPAKKQHTTSKYKRDDFSDDDLDWAFTL